MLFKVCCGMGHGGNFLLSLLTCDKLNSMRVLVFLGVLANSLACAAWGALGDNVSTISNMQVVGLHYVLLETVEPAASPAQIVDQPVGASKNPAQEARVAIDQVADSRSHAETEENKKISARTVSASRFNGLPTVTVPDDCPGVTGAGVSTSDDYSSLTACLVAHPSAHILFRKTQAPGSCDYWISLPLVMNGNDSVWEGVSGGAGSGVKICFPSDVTGIWIPNSTSQNTHIHHLVLQGNNAWKGRVLSTFVIPQMNGGTGANAPGIFVQGDATRIEFTRILDFAYDGIRITNNPLTTPIANCKRGGNTSTCTTVVGHGCATGMAVRINELPGWGGSTASVRVNLSVLNSTTVTFADSGSPGSGTGGSLSCGDWQSGIGLYAVTDLGYFAHNYITGNRGSGEYAAGGDANQETFLNNMLIGNQEWGIYEASFLGNHHIGEQTDLNGLDLTKPGPSVPVSKVRVDANTLIFTAHETGIIANTGGVKQGSQIEISSCHDPNAIDVVSARRIRSDRGPTGYWLQVTVTGPGRTVRGSLSTSGISISGATGLNGTFSSADPIANGWQYPIPPQSVDNVPVPQYGASITDYPSSLNGNYWVQTYDGTSTIIARSNPLRTIASVSSGTKDCKVAVLPGSQVWALANMDGGSIKGVGNVVGSLFTYEYAEANQRAVRCGLFDDFRDGDIGTGFDYPSCKGKISTPTFSTPVTFRFPDPNGVAQGVETVVGGGFDQWDALRIHDLGCTPANYSNQCGMSFRQFRPIGPFAKGDRWFGWRGGQIANDYFPHTYSLLLGYAQTPENLDHNHPPIWIPNDVYRGTGEESARIRSFLTASVPSTGNCNVGDEAINIAPAANGIDRWRCTTAGSPGTWSPVRIGVGAVSSSRTTNPPSAGIPASTRDIGTPLYPTQAYAFNSGPISTSVKQTTMVTAVPRQAQYRFDWSGSAVNGNTACVGGTVQVQLSYIDAASGLAITAAVPLLYNNGTTISMVGTLPTGSDAVNATTNQWSGMSKIVQPKEGTSVQWFSAYTAGTRCMTPQKYQIAVTLTRLQ